MSVKKKPAEMNFVVPDGVKAKRKLTELPSEYRKFRIPGTVVTYVEGAFGAFFKQEVKTDDWIVGWLNFDIKEPCHLYPLTEEPLLALYIGLKGNIVCNLQGHGTLDLPEKKMGFYYVPPGAFNDAVFEELHYTSVYISFAPHMLESFRDEYEQFRPLLQEALDAFFGSAVERHAEVDEAGEQSRLLPVGRDQLQVLAQMESFDQGEHWRYSYFKPQIQLLVVNYFMRVMEYSKLQKDVREAVKYIEANFAHIPAGRQTAINPNDVSKATGIEKSELDRLFNEEFKKPVAKFLTDYRLQRALRLLTTTDIPVAQIPMECGLTDASHLNRLVRDETGQTPKQYRASAYAR
ncbi:helix-turn-helix domain-containing protein [Chitinophaga lutea]